MAAVARAQERWALAWLDMSTGRFRVTSLPPGDLEARLAALMPGELLLAESLMGEAAIATALEAASPATCDLAAMLRDTAATPFRCDAAADDYATSLKGTYLCRDLINTPAGDLGPAELEAVARDLAEAAGAGGAGNDGGLAVEKSHAVTPVSLISCKPMRLSEPRRHG